MHVAVDLDDVTVDFINGMLHSYELEFGETFTYANGSWGSEMVTFFKTGTPALNAAGYKTGWAWLKEREWLWALFPAVPGAIAGIATLRAQGHYVEAVTSKPEWAEHNVWKWLGKWRPAFQRVTITKFGERKVDVTDADVIIDDKLQTCIDFNVESRSAIWFNRKGFHTVEEGEYLNPYLREAANWKAVLESGALRDTTV